MYTAQTDTHGNCIVCKGSEQRRGYRIAFTGTYNEEHEATCADVGTCEDDLAADPNNIGLYVGNLLGQQMIAANLNGAIELPAAVPVLTATNFRPSLVGVGVVWSTCPAPI
jgi:hypothetical protein